MGFAVAEAEFLKASLAVGVRFDRTMMLGRQTLNMSRAELERIAPGVPPGFAEPFLAHLGATETRSIDMGRFGGATDAHDLNDAISEALEEQFSTVIDSGTLEHVFNVPEGLRSAMRMVRPGGHLVMMTPCNDAPGHGFYQFTPELLYRVFSAENGFRVVRFMLHEHRGSWYEVVDPAGKRCEFRTSRTAYIYVIAERTAALPIFATWPQQSDYATEWAGASAASVPSPLLRALERMPRLRRMILRFRSRSWPPSYKRRTHNFIRTTL
jgi:SAM-dependent methyltransferase